MDVATRRVFRRVVCPVCGERRTEMRVFGASREDEWGRPKRCRKIRRELRSQADAWRPAPTCDRCAR
ncbi:hypothetical protein LWP59_36785 [Amycolatopsis acidiphila]|uniref:Uncharacterized protein n=1 Tax=Amycolatopsis acidiphila TaxID=715473 RepID=A0A557ZTR5_9PSEU|nr:hypothetical protein [Amycolatopsis acidiphila]TVT15409.1 hypothetical protein FNH06_36215 [Amycolatopsis acidiphila]UIJ59524.1 hypothetical protein LWP59_36785 [Amycolatopsis acidiphila]GHG80413.1 hypothetical protein GCM10017788_49370 [Amycolatopsis acidiphila]